MLPKVGYTQKYHELNVSREITLAKTNERQGIAGGGSG
jgi:hypothetical protein